mgnify:CR=1 FL=1
MFRIIKEIKPFIITILIIIVLLFVQAMTELALPDYMSNIVNVGIQQNGIENAVPEVIRAEKLDRIKELLNEDERILVENSYRLVRKEDIDEKEFKKYLKKYPILETESLYVLDISSEKNIEELNSILAKAIIVVWGIEQGAEQNAFPFISNVHKGNLPEGIDPFKMLKTLPEEQLKEIMARIDEQFNIMPESIIIQSAINFIRAEYEAIGVNIRQNQFRYVMYVGVIMLLIAILSMGASIAVGFLSARVSSSLGKNLREKVFKKVISFSNVEFDDFSTASLITRSTNDIQHIQMFFIMLLRMVFYAPILGIGGVIRALNTDTSMAWIIAVGVIAVLSLVTLLFSIATPKFKKMQKLIDRVNLVMREALNGLMVIRAFNTQKLEESKFDKANKDLTKTNLFVARLMTFMWPTMMLIMNGISLLIVWVGAHQIEDGTIQVGDMMAFMQYAIQIIMSFLMISMVSIMLPRASVSAQRIAEVIDREIAIKDPEIIAPQISDSKCTIEFKNVSFKYPGAKEYVLKDISFIAKPGETTAFIGGTGSGKSTLINLIPRFYDVKEGQILINGVDIRDMKLHHLREKIGYVPQKSVLFSGTIESNLKYGKNADATDQEVQKAIEIAQAKEFVDEKDKGIQSEISQGGTNVSGGQKQRLSIARALTKKPQIFIFDDSFSALDFRTDAALRKALSNEIMDKTVLIVAQRISTIMNSENIIVLDEGRVVGMGTHQELLKDCDVYKQIALSQLSEEELAI